MKQFKSKEDIYASAKIVFDDEDSCYRCSVCRKEYKTKPAADKHLASQDCYAVQDIIQDTEIEKRIYDMYVSLCAEQNVTYAVSMLAFRKKGEYKKLAKFFLFCLEQGIRDPYQYAEYLVTMMAGKNPYHMLAKGQTIRQVVAYRKFLYKNPVVIPNDNFFQENETLLSFDLSFVCSAVEKAYISIDFLIRHIDLKGLYAQATLAEQLRFEAVCKNVGYFGDFKRRH